ncbi:MAG: c-type cytochrome [Pirellulaceae bacterium]|nr:c-type cytochrome [Pirellulaceae bacterium]
MKPRLARVFLCLLLGFGALACHLPAAELAVALRRPVAIVPLDSGLRLLVANRQSGSLSLVDLATGSVVAEQVVGRRLSDLIPIPMAAGNVPLAASNQLLATDEETHELLLVEVTGESISVRGRLPVSPYPVSICLASDGQQATVASLWSRRLTFVKIDTNQSPTTLSTAGVLDLPFAPRCQHLLSGRDRLIVADAFGGRLGIVDPAVQKLVDTRQFPGHNVRGVRTRPDGKMLVVAHQMLNDLAHSIQNDIHWGLLMSNDLRWLEVDSVLAGGEKLYYGAHIHPLGDPGKGGGDPGGLAAAPDGTVCVSLSGVNQIALGKENDFSMQRIRVGRRPTAVAFSPDSRQLFVANTHDDSVSVVDVAGLEVLATISLGPQPELTEAQQGEVLFYDATLSHDGWMSCHSCHTDGHANGEMNDNLSDRSFGAPKRVLSLFGIGETAPYAWTGEVQTLSRQIENSIEKTMQRGDELPREQVQAIAAFIKTLAVPPPVDVLRGTVDADAVSRGKEVFLRHNCAECHAGETFTSPAAYDVGLVDKVGNRAFNPPSLRGLSHRGPYFHDSSVPALADVFAKHGHPGGADYKDEEVRDLVAYLRSL